MLQRLWTNFWEKAPRQLRFTRAGKILVTIAIAAGGAAMNTGNNLLFFGWGMVLSAIVVSGLLSEATLRVLDGRALLPSYARVNERTTLAVQVRNTSRHFPAYAVEVSAAILEQDSSSHAAAPYQLRIAPESSANLPALFVPSRRGRCQITQVMAKTAYPFGFFEKSRRFVPSVPLHFWCYPRRVNVVSMVEATRARMGEVSVSQVGSGEDFFSLRPFRAGDDTRRVHWRRSARSGRLVVIENEAQHGLGVMLELALRQGAERPHTEHAIATLGSLAEALLERGMRVGIRAPGTYISPQTGPYHARDILLALAKLAPDSVMPPLQVSATVSRVALIGIAAITPVGADVLLPMVPDAA